MQRSAVIQPPVLATPKDVVEGKDRPAGDGHVVADFGKLQQEALAPVAVELLEPRLELLQRLFVLLFARFPERSFFRSSIRRTALLTTYCHVTLQR